MSCKEEPMPKSLIIPPEATAVEYLKFRGMDQLSYRWHISFPAHAAIERINDELRKQGWQAMNEKFLQPGTQSSTETGWTYREDNRVGWSSFLYEWACDWKDRDGNILSYAFQYRDPVEKYRKSTYVLKPGSAEMKVIAIYMPKDVAAHIRKEALRNPAKTPKH